MVCIVGDIGGEVVGGLVGRWIKVVGGDGRESGFLCMSTGIAKKESRQAVFKIFSTFYFSIPSNQY